MKKSINLFIGVVVAAIFLNAAFLFAEESINIPPEAKQLMEKLQSNGDLSDEEVERLEERLMELAKESYESSNMPKTDEMKQFEKSSTLTTLNLVKVQIYLYYIQNSALPESLNQLNDPEKSMLPLGDTLLKDKWGELFQYSIEQEHYVIWSKGADKISGTEDDIRLRSSSESKDMINDMADAVRTSGQDAITINRLNQLQKEGKSIEEIEKILREEQGSPLNAEIIEILNLYKPSNFSYKARNAAARADIAANIATALKLYELDNNIFPNTKDGLKALVKAPNSAKNWQGPYLQKLPKDPWGNPYIYVCPSNTKKGYALFSCGPDGRINTEDDIK